MQLDLTITLGNVIQAGVTVAAVLAAYIRQRDRLTAIEIKLDPLWRQFMREKGANGD